MTEQNGNRTSGPVMVYDAAWHTMGGGEKFMLSVADVLAGAGEQVALLVDDERCSLEEFRSYFDLSLAGVTVERCRRRDVRRHLRRARVAIIQTNFRSVGIPSPATVYMMQIPYGPLTVRSILRRLFAGSPREGLKDCFRLRLVRDARCAALVLTNSGFSAAVLRRDHGLHAEVLYPPVAGFVPAAEKRPMILSVGRFFAGAYNEKRHDILLQAFRSLVDTQRVAGWEYHIAGSADEMAEPYLRRLRALAEGLPVYFHVNASFDKLRQLYAEATLFWHAAGFEVDENQEPERTEHFGISTVEAMSAGCIPLSVDAGGQREIVSHGRSGYLWKSPQDLVELSTTLIRRPELLAGFREAASERAADFSRERFAQRCLTLIHSLSKHTHG